jgi:hypothetical protein
VTVKLFKADGTEVNVGPDGILGTADDATGGMVTDANGKYHFQKLIPGDYYVEFSNIPANHIFTTGDMGDDDNDTDSDVVPANRLDRIAKTIATTLSPNEDDLT